VAKFSIAACLLLALPLAGQVAILEIRVVEGEGGVHLPGSRSARGITVQVTDETGRPVEGASVSFLLPEEGPGGLFANGLRTDVAITDAMGSAAVHGLQWNRTPGRFGIRIVAAHEQARAGIISFQYIAETTGTAARTSAASPLARTAAASGHPKTKWLLLAAIAAGGAVAAGALAGKSSANSATAATAPVAAPGLSIGNPTVSVGKP